VFLKDQIPTSIAAGAYVLLAAISVVAIPHIFRQLQLQPKHVGLQFRRNIVEISEISPFSLRSEFFFLYRSKIFG